MVNFVVVQFADALAHLSGVHSLHIVHYLLVLA